MPGSPSQGYPLALCQFETVDSGGREVGDLREQPPHHAPHMTLRYALGGVYIHTY